MCLLKFSHLPPTEINAPSVRYLSSYQETVHRKGTGLLKAEVPDLRVLFWRVAVNFQSTKLCIAGAVQDKYFISVDQIPLKHV